MESMEATPSTSQAPQSKISHAEKKKKTLHKKKKSRVRKKERRIRESARLRKLIAPKHALLAINEIKGVTKPTFDFPLAPGTSTSTTTFLAESTINGVKYQGTGTSKATAKNDICDQAIRDIMLQKMVEQGKNNPDHHPTKPDDKFPIVALVSYAMHKLFEDLEEEEFSVPGASKIFANPPPNFNVPAGASKTVTKPPPSSTVTSSSAASTSSQMDIVTTMRNQSKVPNKF